MSESSSNVVAHAVQVKVDKESEISIHSASAIATDINSLVAMYASRVDVVDKRPVNHLANFSAIAKIAAELDTDIKTITKSLELLKNRRVEVSNAKRAIVDELTKIVGIGGFKVVSANDADINESFAPEVEEKKTPVVPVSAAAHLASRWGNMSAPVTPTPTPQRARQVANVPGRSALKNIRYTVPGLSSLDVPAVPNIDHMVVVKPWTIRYVECINALVLKTNSDCYMFGHCEYDQFHNDVMTSEVCSLDHDDPNHVAGCVMYHNPLDSKHETAPMKVGVKHMDHTADNMFSGSDRIRVITGWDKHEKSRVVNATLAIAGNGILRAILIDQLSRTDKCLEQPVFSSEYTSRAQRRSNARDNKKSYGNKRRY